MRATKLSMRMQVVLGVVLLGASSGLPAPRASAQTPDGEPSAKYPALPSETPEKFVRPTYGADFEQREVMIPMRDGVKLHTIILIPKGASARRHPTDAHALRRQTSDRQPAKPASRGAGSGATTMPSRPSSEGGYIRVLQDIRGKYGSEGDYVMNRPMRGPLNPTPVDESTDTYDTIDWLVKNLPESNGRVGVLGISYDGFLR